MPLQDADPTLSFGGFGFTGAWSPDGSRLIVSGWHPSGKDHETVLYTVAPDGSDPKTLVTFKDGVLAPANAE